MIDADSAEVRSDDDSNTTATVVVQQSRTTAGFAPSAPAGALTSPPVTASAEFAVKPAVSWPTLPVDLAPLQAALEAVVREIQRTFFNRSPVATVSTSAVGADGVITGSVTAIDPEDDPLSYTVAEGPSGGTVTLNQDGSYAYTASEAHQRTGGVDSFVVSVTDTGRHLHWFNGDGSTQVTVSVFTEASGDDPGNLGATRGFNVYNLTGHAVTFDHWDGYAPAEAPRPGSVLQPGEYAHFELTFYFSRNESTRAWFAGFDGANFAASMQVANITGASSVECEASGGVCGPKTWDSGSTVRLLDRPNTVVVVDSTQKKEQAKILASLCRDNSGASCSFTATHEEEEAWTPLKQYRSSVANPSDATVTRIIVDTQTETYTDSFSFGAKVSAKVMDLVNVELSAKYGHIWTTTHTYTEQLNISVPPWTESIIYSQEPVYRDYGDFVVHVGNTTLVLTDVYFESPDPTRNPKYIITQRKLTPPPPAAQSDPASV